MRSPLSAQVPRRQTMWSWQNGERMLLEEGILRALACSVEALHGPPQGGRWRRCWERGSEREGE
jgi:hypothetical protein